MPDEGKAALSATKGAAHKFINMAVTYLLPLGTFFVGVFTGLATWGGVNALYDAFGSRIPDKTNGGAPARWIGAGLYGGIFGATGYAFWSLDQGTIGRAVGRGFGGYFFGVAVSYLMGAVDNSSTPDGLIDELIAGLKGL
jgi:hypothetical protein